MDEEDLKSIARGSFFLLSPPAYLALNEIRRGKYRTKIGRAIGATVAAGFFSAICFACSLFCNGAILDQSMKNPAVETRRINEKDRQLQFNKREYYYPDNSMLLRGAIFPLEGLARRFTLGNYPKKRDTYFFGTISKEGLEVSVEGVLSDWREPSEITDEDLAKATTSARVLPSSYRNLYDSY